MAITTTRRNLYSSASIQTARISPYMHTVECRWEPWRVQLGIWALYPLSVRQIRPQGLINMAQAGKSQTDVRMATIHGPANLGAVFRLVRGEFNARVRRCMEPSHGRYLTEPAEQPIELSLQAVSRHTYQ